MRVCSSLLADGKCLAWQRGMRCPDVPSRCEIFLMSFSTWHGFFLLACWIMLDPAGIAGQLRDSSELSRLVGVACSRCSCYSKSYLPGQPQARHVIKKEDNHRNKPGTIWLSMGKPVVWGCLGYLYFQIFQETSIYAFCFWIVSRIITKKLVIQIVFGPQVRDNKGFFHILSHFEETARILEKRKDRERREAVHKLFTLLYTFITSQYMI